MTIQNSVLGLILASFFLIPPAFTCPNKQGMIESVSPQMHEVITQVDKAIVAYTQYGLKEFIDMVHKPNSPFCEQQKYGKTGITVITEDGVLLASCKYPGLAGANVLSWQTPDQRFIVQDLLRAVKNQPQGAMITENITNLNPRTGKPSERKQFARRVGNLVFFDHIYNDTDLHKEVRVAENIKKAQDPNNAKSINLKQIYTGL